MCCTFFLRSMNSLTDGLKFVNFLDMKRLKTISMKKGLFEEAESLAITDNAKMEELIIPEGCFPKMQYLSIQGTV